MKVNLKSIYEEASSICQEYFPLWFLINNKTGETVMEFDAEEYADLNDVSVTGECEYSKSEYPDYKSTLLQGVYTLYKVSKNYDIEFAKSVTFTDGVMNR